MKKMVYDLSHVATLNKFSVCRIVVLGLLNLQLKSNIKARYCHYSYWHNILQFIYTCYCNGHRLDLKYFHFAQFLLNAHWAGTENLKFRTDFWDPVLDGWPVIQCFQRQIAQKIFKLKLKFVQSMQVSTLLSNIAFYLIECIFTKCTLSSSLILKNWDLKI